MLRTANYYLHNIRKTRNKLIFTLTKCLIHALVFSRLRYCCILFTTLPFHLLHILETMHRRAVRILYKLDRRMVSISSVMHSLGWLKIRLVCKFRLLCITHRAMAACIKPALNISLMSLLYARTIDLVVLAQL